MKTKIAEFLWSKKRYSLWFFDMLIIVGAYMFFALICRSTFNLKIGLGALGGTIIITAISYSVFLMFGNCYNITLKYSGLYEYMRLACVGGLSVVALSLFSAIPLFYGVLIPLGIIFVSNVFIIVAMVALRVLAKFYVLRSESSFRFTAQGLRTLIIGAGNAGSLMANELRASQSCKYDVLGFVDDNREKRGAWVNGVRVLGDRTEIHKICEELKIEFIVVCIPSSSPTEIQKLVTICSETNCKVKIMPSFEEASVSVHDYSKVTKSVRDVDITDLLERDPIKLDSGEISSKISGKVVMVTGGGGSIGSELCRQIVKFNPKKLVIVDIYENNAYDLQNELSKKYPDLDFDVIIASVRDYDKLESIFETYKPDMVYHAAAHKHVPLMEFSPDEAIKNNVFGTYNTAKCADKFGVSTFTLISTDKAVNPTNVMGATKRICEMVVQAFAKKSKTDFVAVRFGNVLGSNGSVIPLFKRQIAEGGPVTLTHKDITRFFMTIPEASQLVLQASAFAQGGEIFVLDMGKPVKIYHLAEKLIRLSGFVPNKDIMIEVVGLRPGEKLYEELLMDEEGLKKTENSKIFIGQPIFTEMKTLESYLEKLESVLKCGDKLKIKQTIASVVDTYIPDTVNV